ncbi:MAG: hypothetical protein BGO49_08595 [Planctomycetales bacterium 71-10]|nr:MAG: hypothetical protein BGO49_08595 [Planctomycetales bacterium 71-10]
MRCPHCPRRGLPCDGEVIPRLCQLVDPSHPDHRPEYRAALAPPQAYPSIAAQARGLAGSLATWLRAGCPITPAAERARRRAVCTGCPEFDAEARRCRACGCLADVKPWLGTATCPRGKWGTG